MASLDYYNRAEIKEEPNLRCQKQLCYVNVGLFK